MPKKRNAENAGLPARWKHEHGAYFYQVPPGLEHEWDGKKKFRLGSNLSEAYKNWVNRIQLTDGIKTVNDLLDRFLLEVVPTKKPRVQVEYRRYASRLRVPFGKMPLTSIEPQHMYQYVERAKVRGQAIRDVKLMSASLTKAVEWGYISRHPTLGQTRFSHPPPRDRYVEDWEIVECLSLESRRKKGSVGMCQAYIRLKLLTGIARSDLLRLRPAVDFQEQGIFVRRNKTSEKTGKATIYAWTDDLRAVVKVAMNLRPVASSDWLFCNWHGNCYIDAVKETADSWDSVWQRFMDRVLEETNVKEKFTEHDLRAKCASDADSLEHASSLLAHADSKITKRVYRRKPELVTPLPNKFE